jgi:hypothetical protein
MLEVAPLLLAELDGVVDQLLVGGELGSGKAKMDLALD